MILVLHDPRDKREMIFTRAFPQAITAKRSSLDWKRNEQLLEKREQLKDSLRESEIGEHRSQKMKVQD